MTYEERIEAIKEVVKIEKREAFVKDYEATDTEAMGLILTKALQYDGIACIEALCYALEDCNYHTEMREISDKYLKGRV